MTTIISVHAREILDSRGNPPVEADVSLSSGAVGRAAVPSDASSGEPAAVELRDGDPKRYGSKGVLEAVKNVNEVIGPRLEGMSAADQIAVDYEMLELDGTPNKSNLGANAMLSVSLAVARAAAADVGGFAPMLPNNEAALEAILAAIQAAGYQPGSDVAIALDPAASEFYDNGQYVFKKSDGARRSADEMIKLYAEWLDKYPIVSIEDGLAEDDWDGWAAMTQAL